MAKSSNGYLQNRKTKAMICKATSATNRYCSKAKDLFGEETVHVIDEE